MTRIWLSGAASLLIGALAAVHGQGGGAGVGGGAPGKGDVPGSSRLLGPTSVSSGAPAPPAIEEGTAAVSGVVIDGATKQPVPNAIVYLGHNGAGIVGSQNRQVTDAKGRFAFVNLPAKNGLSVGASKPGYLPGGFHRDHRPGTINAPIDLRESEWVNDLEIPLWRPGSISGTVTDERGEPVVGVFVRALLRLRIAGTERLGAGPTTKTDDRGMYRVTDLAPGRYLVSVPSIQSTVPTASVLAAPPRPPGAPPAIPDPSLDVDPQIRLILRNHPIPPSPAFASGSGAASLPGVRFSYPIVLHPSATTPAGASTIDLQYGDHRTGVDVTLQPVTSWRVSGIVDGPPEAMRNLTLRLIPQGFDQLGYGSETGTAYVGADGQFTFLNVPDGTYTLDAPRTFSELRAAGPTPFGGISLLPPPRPGAMGMGTSSHSLEGTPPGINFESRTFGEASAYVGRTTVTVSGSDETNVTLSLRPVGTMTGRVRVEPDTPPPGVTRGDPTIGLRLDPADGDPRLGSPQRESARSAGGTGDFTIPGLLPGRYFLRAGGGFIVKSITWNGRDYTDAPFDAAAAQDFPDVDVVVTDARPKLNGVVRDAGGRPAAGAMVVAFPANETYWTNRGLNPPRMTYATASRTGTYAMSSLPAGEYFVAVVDAAHGASKYEPEFFRAAAAAPTTTRVTLEWGGTATADVRIR